MNLSCGEFTQPTCQLLLCNLIELIFFLVYNRDILSFVSKNEENSNVNNPDVKALNRDD